jgi:ribosomal protein S2
LRFDQVGSVTLFPGEPCTPQIMFNFRSAGSTIWLSARKNETKILTEAAKNNRRVHISGKWRRGGLSNCSYVEVTSAEVTR